MGECYLDGIVSLPIRTFFANSEHTYILAITKKHHHDDIQTDPVFTYLVSNIGERLTSVKREEIEDNNLPEMERLFRIFSADKTSSREFLEKQSDRCKIWDIKRFQDGAQWVIDRWFTREERIAIGAETRIALAEKSKVDEQITTFATLLSDYNQFVSADVLEDLPIKEVPLGDISLFRIFIGKRVLEKDVSADEELIPVYSANVFQPMGYLEKSNLSNFTHPVILWGIDGNFEFNLISEGRQFATTDHCGAIQILHPSIVPEYLLYALTHRRNEETFDRGFRASLTNMRNFIMKVPIKRNGDFNVQAQKKIATRFTDEQKKRSILESAKKDLDNLFKQYMDGERQ